MDKVTLGRTGLDVSVAGLGCGGHSRLGLGTGGSEAQAIAVVQAAIDMGITVIDTAAAYGTEAVVGAAIKGRRDRLVIATKVMVTADDQITPIDGGELRRRVETSLARLGIDCVDILHLHAVRLHDYRHSVDVLLPALADLRAAGKLRFIGITERFDGDSRHQMLSHAVADGHWDAVMGGFNILNQSARAGLLGASRDHGVGVFCMYAVRGALAQRARVRDLVARLVACGEVDGVAVDSDDPLGFVVREGGAESLADAAYRFCRHTPGIHVVLTGTGNVAHLVANVRSITAPPLPAPIVDRLIRIFGRATSVTGNETSVS